MDVELFQKAPFGTLVPISGSLPGGRPWEHWAFLPNPLPDESPELSGQTYRHVGDARAALATYIARHPAGEMLASLPEEKRTLQDEIPPHY